MVETLRNILPIFIYVLLIGLIIIFIIIGIQLIRELNKFDKILDNVEDKINSLNGAISIIQNASSKVALVYSKFSDIILNFISKKFKKKRKEKEDYE